MIGDKVCLVGTVPVYIYVEGEEVTRVSVDDTARYLLTDGTWKHASLAWSTYR